MAPAFDLDLDWVWPGLAVGGRFDLERCPELAQRLGIRAVVDLREEARDDPRLLSRYGMDFLHLPTADQCPPPRERLEEAVRWVEVHLGAGHRVLLHCEHGVGRSALLALCVMVGRGLSPLEALRIAKAARWQVSPSPAQLETYLAFCAQRILQARELPALEELELLAYSHLHGGARTQA